MEAFVASMAAASALRGSVRAAALFAAAIPLLGMLPRRWSAGPTQGPGPLQACIVEPTFLGGRTLFS